MAEPAQEQQGPDIDGVLRELEVDPEQGLAGESARQRREQYGQNSLEEKRTSPVLAFLKHFWGPIPLLIEVAAILAAVISLLPGAENHWKDFGVIVALLAVNVGIGFWHENKAERAVAALKEGLAMFARVRREGAQQSIDAVELVPGDIIVLRAGDLVPADARLLHGESLSLDESALTGESLPVDKQAGEAVYSGTSVKQGEAQAVTVATGHDTEFARIVELVQQAGNVSHFTQAIARIGYFIIGVSLVVVATVILVSTFIYGQPLAAVLLFAVGVLLASIPAAMPAVLSATMSVGARRLAQHKAIVSKLPALEEIASIQTLFVDKTGTLTRGEVEVQAPVVLAAENAQDLLLAAALTCRRDEPDDIDSAILNALEDNSALEAYEVEEFIGFDPTRKRSEVTVRRDGQREQVAKGAPQQILMLVEADSELQSQVEDEVQRLGEQGLRALGVARATQGNWQYLGILPLLDPPREGVGDMIAKTRAYHVGLHMLTGDHAAIGRKVATDVGMGDHIVAANKVVTEAGDQPQVSEQADAVDGLAQVTPEHKFHLVQHFQDQHRIVGMTGDGVNDAPALRQANAGIAVAGAADAARSAADLILTAPGLATITRAIEEARRIFERMTGYAIYRITETIRLLLFIGGAAVLFNTQPVTSIMIVLLAILNDIPIMAIAWDNAKTPDTPVRWDMRRVLSLSSLLGVAGVISSFLAYWAATSVLGVPEAQIQTAMFLKLLVAGHFTLYLTRQRRWFFNKPWPSLWLIAALEATQIGGTLIAAFGLLMPALDWKYVGMIWGYAIVWFLVLDVCKRLTYSALERLEWPRPQRAENTESTSAGQS